jgi:hypothetical protein
MLKPAAKDSVSIDAPCSFSCFRLPTSVFFTFSFPARPVRRAYSLFLILYFLLQHVEANGKG